MGQRAWVLTWRMRGFRYPASPNEGYLAPTSELPIMRKLEEVEAPLVTECLSALTLTTALLFTSDSWCLMARDEW